MAGVRRPWRGEVIDHLKEGQKRQNSFDGLIVGRSGLASSVQGSHEQREIARRRLDEQFLVDIPDASDIEPVHAAGIELMREVAFDSFSSLSL